MHDARLRETRTDLIIGCIMHSFLFELIGMIFVPNKLSFSLGILVGTVTALCCVRSMYRGIIRCSRLDETSARRRMAGLSLLRAAAMFAVCALSLLTKRFSFFGVVIGLFGLKVAAYLHVYTNVYITRKYFRKYL